MDRGIIFQDENVRKIISGYKTHTRRLQGLESHNIHPHLWTLNNMGILQKGYGYKRYQGRYGAFFTLKEPQMFKPQIYFEPCPYGGPGDTLWVRETWKIGLSETHQDCPGYRADMHYRCGVEIPTGPHPWKSPIFMPRWASRLQLKNIAIRVERLQDISVEDAIREGCEALHIVFKHGPSYIDTYHALWDSINPKMPWDFNPWVWVIQFEKIFEARSIHV